MNSKNSELNAAKEKLAKQIDDLLVLEREYDKAIDHSSSYLGYDERIENGRDERARDVYKSLSAVKDQIINQTKLIEALVTAY